MADEHEVTRDVAYFDDEGTEVPGMVDPLIVFYWARLDEEQGEVDPYLRDPFEGASDDERHERHAHRAYEYKTTEGQRKGWPYVDDPPEGDGWELNTTSRDPDAFERFEYTEERYWRRLRPGGPDEWKPSPRYVRQAADVAAKKAILDDYERRCRDTTNPARQMECTLIRGVIRQLATVYDGHPDYRPEWRP